MAFEVKHTYIPSYRPKCFFIVLASCTFLLSAFASYLSQNGLPIDCCETYFSAWNKELLRYMERFNNRVSS